MQHLVRQRRRLTEAKIELDGIHAHTFPERYVNACRKVAIIESEIVGLEAFDKLTKNPRYETEYNRLDCFMAGFRAGMKQERIV